MFGLDANWRIQIHIFPIYGFTSPHPWGRAAAIFLFSVFDLSMSVADLWNIFPFSITSIPHTVTYEIQGTDPLWCKSSSTYTYRSLFWFWFSSITHYISVLAPFTSFVPLVTTEFRIGRRAEILSLRWQLVFDAPVAKFHTLLHTFTFLISSFTIAYYT